MKRILFIFGLMLLVLTACASGKLVVNDPWARPAIAGGTSAAYFVIDNSAGQADTLLSAASDVAQTVELHMTEMQGGVMKMMPQEKIAIPANSKVEFKPGGLHVMFINLKRELKTGDTFALTLRFQNAGEVNLQVKVQER